MSEEQFFISLQATIGGMSANSGTGGETVYGALDVGSGVLLVDVAQSLAMGAKPKRHRTSAMLTNDPTADDFDVIFAETDLQVAIRDYFSFAGRGVLSIGDDVQRHNPASKIEADGLDEHGRKFRLAQDITNGQLAIIALCWFAMRQAGFAQQVASFDEVDPIVRSLGIPDPARREIHGYAMGGKLPLGADGWPV